MLILVAMLTIPDFTLLTLITDILFMLNQFDLNFVIISIKNKDKI